MKTKTTTTILKPMPTQEAAQVMEHTLKLTMLLTEQKNIIAGANDAIAKANETIAGIQKEFANLKPKFDHATEGLLPAEVKPVK